MRGWVTLNQGESNGEGNENLCYDKGISLRDLLHGEELE